jgi:hypothetical protein
MSKHWSVEPQNLIEDFDETRKAHAPTLKEARTWTSRYVNRPAVIGRDGAGTSVLTSDAVRDLGYNSQAKVFRAVLAQVARPLRARVEPTGADWDTTRACRSVAPVLDAIFQQAGFRRTAAWICEWALPCPDVVAVWENDRVSGKRICSRLDPFNTFYGLNRDELKTYRAYSRRWLKEAFCKDGTPEAQAKREAIDRLPDWKPESIAGATLPEIFKGEDLVGVYEAWLAPLSTGSPGRHVMMASKNLKLCNDEWKIEIPAVSMQWAQGLYGASDGAPLARRLGPLQALEDRMHLQRNDVLEGQVPFLENVQDGQRFSDVAFRSIAPNKDGTFPAVKVPPGVPPDLKNEIDDVRTSMQGLAGISEEVTEGTVPSQITSGIGISNYVAVGNQSLSQQHLSYQQMHIDSARINILLGPPPSQDDDKLSAQVDWALLQLPATAFTVSYEVVNELTQHLPYRLDLLDKLFERQAITLDEYLAHVDDGDVEAVITRLNAERDYIEWQIDECLDLGKVHPPVPFQDPKRLSKSAAEAWMRTQTQKVKPPKAHLDALWVLQEQAQEAATSIEAPAPITAATPDAAGALTPDPGAASANATLNPL